MRGAAFLSGVQDAIVIDIGGTTTDVGVLKGGFPRQAATRVKVNVFHCFSTGKYIKIRYKLLHNRHLHVPVFLGVLVTLIDSIYDRLFSKTDILSVSPDIVCLRERERTVCCSKAFKSLHMSQPMLTSSQYYLTALVNLMNVNQQCEHQPASQCLYVCEECLNLSRCYCLSRVIHNQLSVIFLFN